MTLNELKLAGYTVEIKHLRKYKVVYPDPSTNKLVTKYVFAERHFLNLPKPYKDCYFLDELQAKGGSTQITVTCPNTKVSFFGSSKCRSNENYNKAIGIQECLKRIKMLFRVSDGKNGFVNPFKE